MPAIAVIQRVVARFLSLGRHHMQAEFDLAQFEHGGTRGLRQRQARSESDREAATIGIGRDRGHRGNPDIGSNIQQPGFPLRISGP